MKTNLWENCDIEKKQQIDSFCERYRKFLSVNKTERECSRFFVAEAEKHGYRNLKNLIAEGAILQAGDKVYAVNMDKSVMFCVLGEDKLEDGFNIVAAHIDSPRLDLKATPLYESQGFCMLDTHYYGGIKKYQWTARPLALHGVVVKKDGFKLDFVFGEGDDPVVGISDLLPHLEKVETKFIKGEDLNVLAGNIPNADAKEEKFKANILEILKSKNIDPEDLFSAEFEVVPAGDAKNCGLDSSMIMGYGQDDRVCAYTGFQALMQTNSPKRSVVNLLVDKEEIGSVGATGMHSMFFENTIAEIMNLCGQYSELSLRRALTNSNVLSSDVTAGVDPNYVAPFNVATDAHLAKGVSFNKYTGSRGKGGANDANPEFIAQLRDCLDKEQVVYQATEMGKVDEGGGGTIAYIMAKYNMNVIDVGVPVLNMHAPCEITSKIDIYEAFRCYQAFFKMVQKID